MKKSSWVCLAVFVLAAVVIGCGGGGGGGGTGGNGNGGSGGAAPLPGQYLEFIANNRGSNLDPLQLKVGDDIQVVVANYDPGGNRTVLTGKNWNLSDHTHASLTSGGHLKILSRPPGVFSVSATVSVSGVQTLVQQDCAVPATSSTKISGKIVSDDTNEGIKYIQVTMFDAGHQKIGGARTGDGGVFIFDVPSNFDSFSIEGKTVPVPPFYRSFIYKSKVYAMDDPLQCPFRINVISGKLNTLPAPMILWLQVNGPPPPPDGCNQ